MSSPMPVPAPLSAAIVGTETRMPRTASSILPQSRQRGAGSEHVIEVGAGVSCSIGIL